MVYALMYLITMLDKFTAALGVALTTLVVVTIGGGLIAGIIWAIGNTERNYGYSTKEDKESQSKSGERWDKFGSSIIKNVKRAVFWIVVLWSTNAVLPSSRDAAIILAAGQTYSILTGETAQEIAGETSQAIKRMLQRVGVSDEDIKAEVEANKPEVEESKPEPKVEQPKVEAEASPVVVASTDKVEQPKSMTQQTQEYIDQAKGYAQQGQEMLNDVTGSFNEVMKIVSPPTKAAQ